MIAGKKSLTQCKSIQQWTGWGYSEQYLEHSKTYLVIRQTPSGDDEPLKNSVEKAQVFTSKKTGFVFGKL